MTGSTKIGRLHLVGVGVGGPENMTLRAHQTIAAAEVVFGMKRLREQYAGLLSGKETHEAGHGLFEDAGPRTEARLELEERTRTLLRAAVAAGRNVAVLTLGDPLIFGSQSGYLREFADLKPAVVPGLSSLNVANAALGRKITGGPAVVLTAGMDGEALELLAAARPTLVLYTMRLDLPATVARLKRHYPGETPAAVVSHAGSPQQEVLFTSLDGLVQSLDGAKEFERLIYIGDSLR